MKTILNFSISYHSGWILGVVALAVFGQVAISQSAERMLVRPADVMGASPKADVSYKPYENRKGRVVLATEVLPQPSGATDSTAKIAASKGDAVTVTLSFFPDVTYEVMVNSVVHHSDGTIVINGSLCDHKIATVVLTIGTDGFLITLQDMNQALLYRVAGNSRLAEGEVTEIDMTKMPPMIR